MSKICYSNKRCVKREKEEVMEQLDSIKRYMRFVKPYRWLLILTIFIGILKFAIPLLLPWIVQIILDNILLEDGLSAEEKTKQLFT